MTDRGIEKGLLPEGLRDALPPEAAHGEAIVRRLLDLFAAHGYDQVAPPLVEFEEGLAGRLDAASRLDMFRLLDPESQRVMVLRSDITGQIARIAATRLGHLPRPLRLGYAGSALRVKGSQLRPERQFRQAGIELIGPRSLDAAAEVVLIAEEALVGLGVAGISIDLVFPRFVPVLAQDLGLDEAAAAHVRAALDAKDVGQLAFLPAPARARFESVLAAAGPADQALAALRRLDLPARSASMFAAIDAFVARLFADAPQLCLTIDPGEHRGFAYQGDFGFTLFGRGERGELGRGGRYGIRRPEGAVEPATGFTLYLDSLARAVPPEAARAKLLVPPAIDRQIATRLRAEGWATVQALAPVADLRQEARRLGCSHAWIGDAAVAVARETRAKD
ncbi:MAG: ATP phosphoribosyltransferase regulatory subunit [Pseudomonadota bacterium]